MISLKKKILILITILILGGLLFSGCSSGGNDFDLNGNTKITGQVITSNRSEYVEAAPSSLSNNKSIISLRVNSGSPKYIEDEIVVKYDRSAQITSMNNNVEVSGLNISKEIETGSGKLVKIEIPENKTVEEMIEYFNQKPEVAYAEPNYIVYAQAVPDDSYYEEYKNGDIGQWGLWAINMLSAWDEQKYSGSVKVAVLDSGVVPDHPDFDSNDLTEDGVNFVDTTHNQDPINYSGDDQIFDDTSLDNGGSHGTHVAGIIGSLTNNSRGVGGVSWGVDLMPVKVLDSTQTGSTFEIAEGIYYATDYQADIINLSLGSSNELTYLKDAVKYASDNNVVLIAASGNYEDSSDDAIFYPAAYSEVIAVGAVDINNNRTDYSTSGSELDLVAPGGTSNYGILSTWGYYDGTNYNTGYNYMSGTSMASAFVSGAAALLLESGVSPNNIKKRLTSTAYDLGNSGKDDKYGYGMLDVYGALLGKKTEVPNVFIASKSDNKIYKESTPVKINSNGSYVIAEEIEGSYYLVAWRDVNENGTIDGGDFFGITDRKIYFEPETIYEEQDINMYYVKPDTAGTSSSSFSFEVID